MSRIKKTGNSIKEKIKLSDTITPAESIPQEPVSKKKKESNVRQSFYISPSSYKMLLEMSTENLQKYGSPLKSELIDEAIVLLYHHKKQLKENERDEN